MPAFSQAELENLLGPEYWARLGSERQVRPPPSYLRSKVPLTSTSQLACFAGKSASDLLATREPDSRPIPNTKSARAVLTLLGDRSILSSSPILTNNVSASAKPLSKTKASDFHTQAVLSTISPASTTAHTTTQPRSVLNINNFDIRPVENLHPKPVLVPQKTENTREDSSVRHAAEALNTLLKPTQDIPSPRSQPQEQAHNVTSSELFSNDPSRLAAQREYSANPNHLLSSSNVRGSSGYRELNLGMIGTPSRESHQNIIFPTTYENTAPLPIFNEYFQENPLSTVPETPRLSQRLSHTSRVQAFNSPRSTSPLRSVEPRRDTEDLSAYIPEKSSFAVVIPSWTKCSTRSRELLSLPYNGPVSRNQWTSEQRWTLAFMRKTFALEKTEQVQIFNALFRDDLMARGLADGITAGTLSSQWHDMKSGSEGYQFWTFFNLDPKTWDRNLTDLQERIQKTATGLGIIPNIRTIEEDSAKKHGHRRGKRLPKNAIRRYGLGIMPFARRSMSRLDDLPARRKLMTETSPGMAPFAKNEQVFMVDSSPTSAIEAGTLHTPKSRKSNFNRFAIPKLGYRWFNFQSQGVNGPRRMISGLHTEYPARLSSPDPESEEFKLSVHDHMNRIHVLTPFISLFRSILPCLHRALSHGDSAGISIIDLQGCNNDLRVRLGMTQDYVFSAGKLVEDFGFILPGNYSASTEFLVYGDIFQKNILCTFSKETLAQIATSHPDIGITLQLDVISSHLHCTPKLKRQLGGKYLLNDQTGQKIGKLLYHLNAPELIIEEVGCNIARAWRFKGRIWNRYIAGVNAGYRKEQKGKEAVRSLSGGGPTAVVVIGTATDGPPSTQDTNDLPNTEYIGSMAPITCDLQLNRGPLNSGIIDLTDVDVANPFDVDFNTDDNEDSNASQPVDEKVLNFLDGLEAAAGQFEDIETAAHPMMDLNAGGAGGNGPDDKALSLLERHAIRKGVKLGRAPQRDPVSILDLFGLRSDGNRLPSGPPTTSHGQQRLRQGLTRKLHAMSVQEDDEGMGSQRVSKRLKEGNDDPFTD